MPIEHGINPKPPADPSAAGQDEPLGPDALTVGVGPWLGELPDDDRLDPELLAGGDRRNVVDRYRYWRVEDIVADLDTRRHGFHVGIENLAHDMNIGSVVRTANAFNAASVQIIGRRRWNRRGAMVTDRYMHVGHLADASELAAWAEQEGVEIVAVDNLPGAVPLETFDFPDRCLLVFGQESNGISDQVRDLASATIEITQFGSTRSINAGAAAAVTMHAWVRQHVFKQT